MTTNQGIGRSTVIKIFRNNLMIFNKVILENCIINKKL